MHTDRHTHTKYVHVHKLPEEPTKVTFDIPKELVVNMDETGVNLLPLRTRGWAPKGRKEQVVFHGKNDKRQFTFCPMVSAAAALIFPMMLIWGGPIW